MSKANTNKANTNVSRVLAEMLGKQKGLAPQMSRLVAEAVKHLCQEHGSARIPGLGTFQVKVRSPRKVRNPRTGEILEKGETRKIRFKPEKNFLV